MPMSLKKSLTIPVELNVQAARSEQFKHLSCGLTDFRRESIQFEKALMSLPPMLDGMDTDRRARASSWSSSLPGPMRSRCLVF
mmetsp:Transcript_114425/g.369853  ORF Transcript_114425/g.369853 Transcript_114425/m.369853 type:complete len:83 (+) Transcript_114425:147-395(+)